MSERAGEELIERRSSARRLLDTPVALLAVIVAATAAGVALGVVMAGSPATAPEGPGLSPSATPSDALRGTGPFVVFASPDRSAEDAWIVNAADLSTVIGDLERRIDAHLLQLGRVEGSLAKPFRGADPGGVAAVFAQTTVHGAPTTNAWFVRRERTFGRPEVSTLGSIESFAVSPDGAKVGAFVVTDRPGTASAALCTWTVVRPAQTCGPPFAEPAMSPESAPLPVAWLGSGEIVEYPYCACDYWAPPSLFAVPPEGGPRPLSWLGRPASSEFASSSGGAFIVYEDARNRQCTGDGPGSRCGTGPLLLTRADLRARKTRTLASTQELEFVDPLISPNGHHVAYGTGRAGELAIVDSLGREETTIDFAAVELRPVAFLGDNVLLFAAVSPDPADSSHTHVRFVRILFAVGSWGQPGIVASGRDLEYLGWIR